MAVSHSTDRIEYRPIEGFPNYRIGNDGSVWSRLPKNGKGGIQEWWRRLKPWNTSYGHLMVCLRRSGKTQKRAVHQLVLEAFDRPRPKGMECCHNDGVPTNNHINNLRWDTHTGNIADTLRHGTRATGEKHAFAKLNDSTVRQIRKRYAQGGVSQTKLAKEFGVASSQISLIVNRKTWKWVDE